MTGARETRLIDDILRATGGRVVSGETNAPYRKISTDSRTVELQLEPGTIP